MPEPVSGPRRILVIRRDNIGDLICTTPMLHQLRVAYPAAWIAVLVNRYNAEVLRWNPDVDAVFAYQKAKHRPPGVSRWQVWLETAGILWQLRRTGFDQVILASPGAEHLSRWLGARQVYHDKGQQGHEVERCAEMLATLGIRPCPGPLVIRAARTAKASALSPVMGIHLSARKVRQRWPAAAFVELIRQLFKQGLAGEVRLFWAPGAAADPLHPGDDDKLRQVMAEVGSLPVTPVPTLTLRELIDGIDVCDEFICSDGGAMHIAAGLGKPIVCFFGNSGAERWHPWGVPHLLLQPESLQVSDITVDMAVAALVRLRQKD